MTLGMFCTLPTIIYYDYFCQNPNKLLLLISHSRHTFGNIMWWQRTIPTATIVIAIAKGILISDEIIKFQFIISFWVLQNFQICICLLVYKVMGSTHNVEAPRMKPMSAFSPFTWLCWWLRAIYDSAVNTKLHCKYWACMTELHQSRTVNVNLNTYKRRMWFR